MHHANLNVSLMVENGTGIKSGITVSASENWKEHNAFENIWVYDIAFKTFIGGKTIAY